MNINDNKSKYRYYGNYDKNVKAIKGGGVITPSVPPNRSNTTGTIKNTWESIQNDNITITPPVYKSVYYSNPILTDGYLNSNNYVDEDKYISDHYYPSQKFDKVLNIKSTDLNYSNEKILLNKEDPFEFPPGLITSKYTKDNKYKKKINKRISSNDINFVDFIKKNSLYDGKYIYTIENPNNFVNLYPDPKNKFTKILPFFNTNFNNNIINEIVEYDDINSQEIVENFSDNSYDNNDSESNVILLIIFSILLIFYFSFYQK